MTNVIKNILSESIKLLEESKDKISNVKRIIIDQDFFNDDYCVDFTTNYKTEYLTEQMQLISECKGPVIYWFEFENTIADKYYLKEFFLSYKIPLLKQYSHPNYRYTSSYKKDSEDVTNILYVGKVEKDFIQRIKTHLGYAVSPFTAGMQLHYWYGCNIQEFGNLTLNYIEFDNKMNHLIAIVEKKLALDLKPLIGKY